MSYWKYAQTSDFMSDRSKLTSGVKSSQGQEQKKSSWGKWGGLIGSIGAPLLVASTFFSGGTMPLLYGMLAAGAGGYAGRKAGSAFAGDSKELPDVKFLTQDSSDAKNALAQAKADRNQSDFEGSLWDMAAFGGKGLLKASGITDKATQWLNTKLYGPEVAHYMAGGAAGSFDPAVYDAPESFTDIFKGADIDLKKTMLGDNPILKGIYGNKAEVWRDAKDELIDLKAQTLGGTGATVAAAQSQYEAAKEIIDEDAPWYYKLLTEGEDK